MIGQLQSFLLIVSADAGITACASQLECILLDGQITSREAVEVYCAEKTDSVFRRAFCLDIDKASQSLDELLLNEIKDD